MSKAPKNIEKILLGAAVVIAAGLVVLGVMKAGAVEEDFSAIGDGQRNTETAVADAELVSKTFNSLKLDRTLEEAQVDSPEAPGGNREVDLFVGVPLYANRDNPNEPFDPITSPPIHPPIPNTWWLEYDVSFNFADSPQRDPDQDGFTNLEEWQAKTNPSDSASNPPLVAKLSYIRDESYEWLVEYGFEAQGKWYPKVEDGAGKKNKVPFEGGLEPGDLFFTEDQQDGILANRFKFIRIEDREVRNERLNIMESLKFGIYEDQKPNKLGMEYEVPNRMPRAERGAWIHYDRTAVLELKALGMEGDEFRVEEFTPFSLPPDGEDKKYFMKEVTPERIVVEWEEDGEKRSVEIPKGGMPRMDLTR